MHIQREYLIFFDTIQQEGEIGSKKTENEVQEK